MNKQKKPAGKPASKTRNEYNAERVRRWREWAEKRATLPGYDSARLVAAEEGKSLPELVVDILCRQRLRGKIVRDLRPLKGSALKGSAAGKVYNAFVDTLYEERESTRSRNSHERELIERTLMFVAHNRTNFVDALNARERRALLRRFYSTGDFTVDRAIIRAIRFAIETKIE